jgi:hypothetical protein
MNVFLILCHMIHRPVFVSLIIVCLSVLLYYFVQYTNNQIRDPDAYSPEGYCIVNTAQQMALGLSRFKTENDFLQKCNGKMIFEFTDPVCRTFTSDKMHFPIILNDINTSYYLDVNSNQQVCGKRIIEELVKEMEK